MPRRLAVVLSHPTQYYSPWFRWLRAHTDLNFRVFYLWDAGVKETFDSQFQQLFAWDVDLVSGYDHEFVANTSIDPGMHHFGGLRNPGLLARLAAYEPDAMLLFGYKSLSHLQAIAWARIHRVPLLFRGDSHLLGRERPSTATRAALNVLYAQFKAFAYVGAANRDYFSALGVGQTKLFFSPHAVDRALFDRSQPEHQQRAALLRQQLGVSPSTRVVLFAGKFVAAKQPAELLAAFLDVQVSNTAMVFLGDGEERGVLQADARRSCSRAIHFLPFANQSQMPAHYLAADIFALPSRGPYETWGLAVNEAMEMGVPCIVSDRVGCQRDLVTDDETGWVFRADDPGHLRERLHCALIADLQPFRPRVAARIANYSYRHSTEGLQAALHACLG